MDSSGAKEAPDATKDVVFGRFESQAYELDRARDWTLNVPALLVVPPAFVRPGLKSVEATLVCGAGRIFGDTASGRCVACGAAKQERNIVSAIANVVKTKDR